MIPKMKLLQVTIFLYIILSGYSYGQKNETPRDVIIYCYQLTEGYEKIYINARKGEPYTINLTTANTMGEYKTLQVGGKVSLLEKTKNEEGEMIYSSFLDVKIPEKIKKPLIFLVPTSGKAEVPYSYFVFDWNEADFKPGSFKFINFSPYPVRGLIGKSKVSLLPRKTSDVDITKNGNGMQQVQFKCKKEDNWKDFAQARWPLNVEKRILQCVFVDQRTKRMKMKGVPLKPITPLRHRGEKDKPAP